MLGVINKVRLKSKCQHGEISPVLSICQNTSIVSDCVCVSRFLVGVRTGEMLSRVVKPRQGRCLEGQQNYYTPGKVCVDWVSEKTEKSH